MVVRIASSMVGLTLAFFATSGAAASLQPIDPWKLDYGETQCTAGRSFGSASSPVVLGIVPSLSGGTYRLLVSVQRTGPIFAQQVPGTVDVGQASISSQLLYYGGKGVRLSVYQARLSAAQMQQARSAATVRVRVRGQDYSLAVSDMPAILDGLSRCNVNLQHYWNADRTAQLRPAAFVDGDLRSLLTSADYPTQANISPQLQRAPQLQVLVDPAGSVAGCDVLSSSGSPLADTAACETITQRARFNPARDIGGVPVRSVLTTPPLAWNSSAESIFDNGCRTMTSSGLALLSNCTARLRAPMQIAPVMPARTGTPPPKKR